MWRRMKKVSWKDVKMHKLVVNNAEEIKKSINYFLKAAPDIDESEETLDRDKRCTFCSITDWKMSFVYVF
jgi:hypothetical protein